MFLISLLLYAPLLLYGINYCAFSLVPFLLNNVWRALPDCLEIALAFLPKYCQCGRNGNSAVKSSGAIIFLQANCAVAYIM